MRNARAVRIGSARIFVAPGSKVVGFVRNGKLVARDEIEATEIDSKFRATYEALNDTEFHYALNRALH